MLVLSNGAVEKHTLELDQPTPRSSWSTPPAAQLAGLLVGRTSDVAAAVRVGDLGQRPDADGVGRIVAATLAAMGAEHRHDDQRVHRRHLRMAAAFDAVGTVSEILRILEQQFVVVSLLEDVLDRGLNVAIGTETGIQPLADCSLVVAPYEVDGEPAGTIGVLGPTRMHYPQALAAVAVVSQRLGRRLSEG